MKELATTILNILLLLKVSKSKGFWVLLTISGLSAMLDALGAASIMPLIGFLLNPKAIEKYQMLSIIQDKLGVVSEQSFLILICGLYLLLIVASSIIKAASSAYTVYYSLRKEHELGTKLFWRYLSVGGVKKQQDERSNQIAAMISDTALLATNGIVPITALITQGLVLLCVTLALSFLDPNASVAAFLIIGLTYLWLIWRSSKRLGVKGEKRADANSKRLAAIDAGFNLYDEIAAYRAQTSVHNRFDLASREYASSRIYAQVTAVLPRFALEGLGFGLLILYIMVSAWSGVEITTVMPVIAVLAVAGYRIIPAAQQVYRAVTQLRFVATSVANLKAELDSDVVQMPGTIEKDDKDLCKAYDSPFPIGASEQSRITLEVDILRARDGRSMIIKDRSFSFEKGKIYGLVGKSGSGKTSFLRALSGCASDEEFKARINGVDFSILKEKIWPRHIAIVSQGAPVFSGSVSENISFFGKGRAMEALIHQAASAACVHDVINSMDGGYNAILRSNGSNISGGQKQRICLARALYKRPQFLLLDEATSGIEPDVEREIFLNVRRLLPNAIILLAAHDQRTLSHCDEVFSIGKWS